MKNDLYDITNIVLDLIEKKHLRNMQEKKSNDMRFIRPVPSGKKDFLWRYTEAFLSLCKKEILGIEN